MAATVAACHMRSPAREEGRKNRLGREESRGRGGDYFFGRKYLSDSLTTIARVVRRTASDNR